MTRIKRSNNQYDSWETYLRLISSPSGSNETMQQKVVAQQLREIDWTPEVVFRFRQSGISNRETIIAWVKENCQGRFLLTKSKNAIYFERTTDAMLFRFTFE